MMPSDIYASLQTFSRHNVKGLSGDRSEKYPYPVRADPPDVPLLWPLFCSASSAPELDALHCCHLDIQRLAIHLKLR